MKCIGVCLLDINLWIVYSSNINLCGLVTGQTFNNCDKHNQHSTVSLSVKTTLSLLLRSLINY